MKKQTIGLIGLLFLGALVLSACEKKGPAEEMGEKIDNAAESAKESVEEASDVVEEKVEEAGEKIEEATGH